MKLAKDFLCVPPGEIYPRVIPAGEDCPQEHVGSARALGLLAEDADGKEPAYGKPVKGKAHEKTDAGASA